MSGALGEEPEGATPLTEEDREGLIPAWVTTRDDLNRAEGDNILRARTALQRSRRRKPFWYLEAGGLETLHKQMFEDVWAWAGTLRRRQTNIGVSPEQIAVEMHNLRLDTLAQIGDGTDLAYPATELAVRFHHRLVAIHPFPNGNGRHSRFVADLLIADLGGARFTWGGSNEDLAAASQRRTDYITALRQADSGEFRPLIDFATRE